MQPGLEALIHPRPLDEFRSSYQDQQPFVVHGAKVEKLGVAALTGLPLLESLESLLRSWPDPVSAHLPDVADEASSVAVSPGDARKLFSNGMSLLFNDVHQHAPSLLPWLAAIRVDLGLSALTQCRCLVYATPKNGGTAPHFDQNVNFVLQLHGTKTWWLAANRHVDAPLTRHTMGLTPDPELETYATLPLPRSMPEDRFAVVLEPGSLLMVPRGVWHCTEATSDALSLNFTYSAPSWIDVFTAALRGRLALSTDWRQTAGLATAGDFDVLLRELADEAPYWNASDILEATEAGDAPAGEAAAGSANSGEREQL